MAQRYTSLDGVSLNNTWLTIGSFDGVHIGHQHLIRELNHSAHLANSKSIVLTFHPHPSVVLRGRKDAFYLTTVEEKAELIEELGVDAVVIHPFTYEISQSSARDFVKYLSEHLDFRELWVGNDFALGKGREGNVNYLKELGINFNYQVLVVEPVTSEGQAVSSSYIRQLIAEGLIEKANELLGRPYLISGEVVHGDGRGKGIGIPTANLDTGNEKLIPLAGIYACRAIVMGKYWPAAVNIGTRPTFDNTDNLTHVEAHLLDFNNDLYKETISLEFISRLRGEQKFNSVAELIDQIQVDITKTREIIGILQKE